MPATLSLADLPSAFFLGQDRTGGPLVPELVAPTYRAEIAGFPVMDEAGHGHFGRAFYAGFPDMRHVIEQVVVADPHVTVRFTLHGTHTGAFMHLPPTGKSVNVSAMALLTVEDGRVTHLQAMFDQMGMLRQLGALPG